MDVKDQTKHTISSGHENHSVHLCHRCQWPFPNPHPSARHRRAHKKICGTVEGYTTLIGSDIVSDDERHHDDEKDKTPSPTIEKKLSIGGDGGVIGGRISRSEEDLFSDAVTEFADSGVEDRSAVNKTLDRDLFFSFNDAENGGSNEVENASSEISKVEANIGVPEKINSEKIEETEKTNECESFEAKLELPVTDEKFSDDLVKHESTPEHSTIIEEFKAAEVEVSEMSKTTPEVSEMSRTTPEVSEMSKTTPEVSEMSETIPEVPDLVKDESTPEHATIIKESKEAEVEFLEISKLTPEVLETSKTTPEVLETSKTTPEVSATVDVEQEKFEGVVIGEKLEVPAVDAVCEEIIESEPESFLPEVKESEVVHCVEGINEESKHEKIEVDHQRVSEVIEESEVDHKIEEIIEEIKVEKLELKPEVDQSHSGLTKVDSDLGALESEKCSDEKIQEIVKESDSVLIEKDLDAPENCSTEQIHEVFKEPVASLTEIKHLGADLTRMEDLDAPNSEKSSNENTHEVIKEPESVFIEKENLDAPVVENCPVEQIQEVFKEPESDLIEKEDLDEPISEKSSNEQIQEILEKPESDLIEKENLCAPNSEKCSTENTQEILEKSDKNLIEKEDLGAPESEKCSIENTEEILEIPNKVLIEKENLGAPQSEKSSIENTQEIVKKTNTILIEKENLGEKSVKEHTLEVVEEPKSTLTENELEKCSNEIEEPEVADVSIVENIALKETEKSVKELEQGSVLEGNNGKLVINRDSGVDFSVDSSSRNSVEGNWGSVSVLSTASIDAESLLANEKSKVNYGKSVAGNNNSEVFDPPSFMTLVDPEVKDSKPEGQNGQSQTKPEAGWFPTLTKVNNESEGRKRNEEVIAKVTNWTTEKHSTPLKSLLGEAKSPNDKKTENVVQKDEALTEKTSLTSAVNHDLLTSPPKLIEDGKKTKKAKGRGSWVPFVCCSSVNVVN